MCSNKKTSKLNGIPKLDDANDAGTKNSLECTLILTEGDSAKSMAMAGLGVIGRDRYGVFPLGGKVLNVRKATRKKIMENAEINNLIKIIGLEDKKKYDNTDSMRTLRYGKIMIMTNQDQDGSHIKGLVINFIHNNWPSLLKQNFIEEFITPFVKVTKNKDEKSFYSLPEFEEWKQQTDKWLTYKVKYYKGLGTSTAKETKEYFSDMKRNRIPFQYAGVEDDASIVLAFSKKKVDKRKEWLTNWMDKRKRPVQKGLPELYVYGKQTSRLTYNEFVNHELILFSNMDNERSIPCLVDGFKPGQRKVIFTCFKRKLFKEMKVAKLAGSVAELSSYHHGEQNLLDTIINLAQNFVGSNNLNLLQPLGQFGTRFHGGKDAASPRYIFTMLSPLARHIFNENDDALLKSLYDDNRRIEPEWYVPIIPMVLVNGAEGIGTGWSTNIPNYNVREIVFNMRRMLDNQDPLPMIPSFKNFRGTIEQLDNFHYAVRGEVGIMDDQTVEISELPVRVWTQAYKEGVMETMLNGSGDKVPPQINDYKEYHTDSTVQFVVKMAADKLKEYEELGLHKQFQLQNTIRITNMVLFDGNGCIKKYGRVEEIMKEFYDLRLDFYQRRKDYMEGMLAAESLKLKNIDRFICEEIGGWGENKMKKDIIQVLVGHGYDSDPTKAWSEAQSNKEKENQDEEDQEDSQAAGPAEKSSGPDYGYLLNLPVRTLWKEDEDELCRQRDAKAQELVKLRGKTPKDLWRDDLNAFSEELEKVEKQERDDEIMYLNRETKQKGGAATAKGAKAKKGPVSALETKPSPAVKREKLQVKKEAGDFGIDETDDASQPASLVERIATNDTLGESAAAVLTKKKRAPKKEKGAADINGTPKKAARKPAAKKKTFDDSDADDDIVEDGSDVEFTPSKL